MHRDFKTANIFLHRSQNKIGGNLIVGDFGLSKSGVEMTTTRLGTPFNMAPEVLDNTGTLFFIDTYPRRPLQQLQRSLVDRCGVLSNSVWKKSFSSFKSCSAKNYGPERQWQKSPVWSRTDI